MCSVWECVPVLATLLCYLIRERSETPLPNKVNWGKIVRE
jgi:hypothetical protein